MMSNCAIIAEEGVVWHVFNVCVPVNDVGYRCLLDFLNNFSWVGRLKPKSICISNAGELLACDGGSQFTKHRPLHFDLSKHSNIGVDVVD